MKKSSIILAAAALVSVSAVAQEKNNPNYTPKWSDGIFISVAGGAQTSWGSNPNPFGEIRAHSYPTGFWKQVDPYVQAAIGKYINPLWSFRLKGSGYRSTEHYGARTTKNYFNVGVDGIWNITNAFLGYKPEGRVFELSGFAGPLANVGVNPAGPKGGTESWQPGVNGGLQAKFNLTSRLSLDFEGTVFAYNNVTTKIRPTWYGALSGGLSYKFGASYENDKSKLDASIAAQDALNDEINANKAQIADLQRQLAAAKNVKPTTVAPPVQPVAKCDIESEVAVWFKIGKATLDDQAKTTIDLVSKIIKADPNGQYSVVGYTDKATGSNKVNEKLSAKRAGVVYDALLKAGVDKAQVTNDGGVYGQPNIFASDALNRVAVIKRK